ncbi:MAG: helix-hairpin-helix domain-containing protein [Candidatus Omnitrophota bacterium]
MALYSFVFQQSRAARAYKGLVLSQPMARSAVAAAFHLIENDRSPYDTLERLTQEKRLDFCAGNSIVYFFADKADNQDGQQVVDEGALVNLNLASVDILEKLPGISEEAAENIASSRFKPFASVNEVLLVEGVTKEDLLLFKDLVTVHGIGKVNINTAPKEVLVALGLDESLAELLIRFRSEHLIEPEEGSKAIASEYGISDTGALIENMRQFSLLSLRQEQDLISLLPKLSVKSEYLRLNLVAYFGKERGTRYSIVICPATKKVLSWREF